MANVQSNHFGDIPVTIKQNGVKFMNVCVLTLMPQLSINVVVSATWRRPSKAKHNDILGEI